MSWFREVERYQNDIVRLDEQLGPLNQIVGEAGLYSILELPMVRGARQGFNANVLEFTPVDERVAFLPLHVGEWTLRVDCANGPNISSKYPAYLEALEGVLEGAPSEDSIILLYTLSLNMGKDSET